MVEPKREDPKTSRTSELQAEGGRQPRGRKFPEIIPEFKAVTAKSVSPELFASLGLEPGMRITGENIQLLELSGEATQGFVSLP